MGRSLHNKIHLGRRNALFNMNRLQTAAGVFAAASVGLVVLLVKTFK